MIVGSGLIARVFKNLKIPDDIIIHASGVSDSSCVSDIEFFREKTLVENSLRNKKKLFYFSSQSCSNEGLNTPYVIHKRKIEKTILTYSPENVVIRIPQIASRTGNSNNLIHAFYNMLVSGQVITCYNGVQRNLIKDIHLEIVFNHIIQNSLSGLLSFSAPHCYTPLEILNSMENISNLKAKVKIIVKHDAQEIFLCSKAFRLLNKKLFHQSREKYLSEVIKHAIELK